MRACSACNIIHTTIIIKGDLVVFLSVNNGEGNLLFQKAFTMLRLEKPFLLLSPPGVYPDMPHFHSAFEFAAWLQTAQAGLTADWQQWPYAKGQAGTRLKVKPKRPQMFASRNGFSIQIRIMLIANWNYRCWMVMLPSFF